MTRDEAVKGLLQAVDELHTHFWEGDDPRSSPIAFEVGECNAWLRIIQEMDRKVSQPVKKKVKQNDRSN